MKFGVHFQLPCSPAQSAVQRYRDTIDQAIAAQALGFESVWPVEQHFEAETSILPAPMLLLAAIAARTTTLRLGTAVTLLPLANPVRVAEEIATLDVLSAGRVECGVGRGMDPAHFAGLGVAPAESYPRLEEGIEIVRRALAHERFSYDGRFHHLTDVTVVPRPQQWPHPPIRLAVNSVETLELAGRLRTADPRGHSHQPDPPPARTPPLVQEGPSRRRPRRRTRRRDGARPHVHRAERGGDPSRTSSRESRGSSSSPCAG